jgi:endonuclease YncB( thermonuclease family)
MHRSPSTASVLTLSALLALLLLLVVSRLWSAPVIVYGKVVGCHDGDSFTVLTRQYIQFKVRLASIDAPELHQVFGQRAKQAMSELVFGREVELHSHTIHRYGRTVAIVYVDGTDAGLEMIRRGLACCLDRYLPEASGEIQASYRQAQEEARAKRLDLWADPDPLPPWEFRHQRKASSVVLYYLSYFKA